MTKEGWDGGGRAWKGSKHLPRQSRIEVPPHRIVRLDQRDLPFSRTTLDLFFAPDGMFHRGMKLIPDQYLAAISSGETVNGTFPVLPYSADEIGGYAHIDRPVALAGHDI